MTLYDAIGKNYSLTRKRDPRIAATLLEILQSSQGSTIVDIGAGTGSYATFLAEHGYRVISCRTIFHHARTSNCSSRDSMGGCSC